MIYAIGPYEQRNAGGGLIAWMPPAEARGAIDLRPLARQSDPGALFCVLPDGPVPDGFMRLGESLDEVQDGRRMSHWRKATGSRAEPGTLREVLWQTLTVDADPTGQDRASPLMPTTRRQIEIHCGGRLAHKRWSLNAPEAAVTIEVMRQQYREARELARSGRVPDPEHHRRVMDYMAEKLSIRDAEDVLIPADLPRETRLKHATTLTESFNKADGSGWDADLTWGTVAGSVETVSNRARGVSAAGLIALYADSTLSGTDMYSECEVHFASHSNADYMGPICRQPGSSTNTHYWSRHFNTNMGQTFKFVAGAGPTAVGVTTTSASMSSGLVSRLECNGSNIIRIYNGTTENTASDPSITTNNYCGIRGRRFSASLFYEADNWQGGDLGAAPAVSAAIYQHRTLVVPPFGG